MTVYEFAVPRLRGMRDTHSDAERKGTLETLRLAVKQPPAPGVLIRTLRIGWEAVAETRLSASHWRRDLSMKVHSNMYRIVKIEGVGSAVVVTEVTRSHDLRSMEVARDAMTAASFSGTGPGSLEKLRYGVWPA
jgi:hypothetical protein